MIRHALAALDRSTRCEDVLSCLACLRHLERVTLLHVRDERHDGRELPPEGQIFLRRCREHLEERGLRVDVRTPAGIPFDEILHQARGVEADLVALGKADSPRWKAFLLGETELRVLQLAPLPVLVCRRTDRDLGEDLVLGLDFSADSREALEWLRKQASDSPGKFPRVELLHIHEQRNIDLLLHVVDRNRIEEIIDEEAREMETMAQSLRDAGVREVTVRMRTGRVPDEMDIYLKERRPSLVVLGAQGTGRCVCGRVGKTVYQVAQVAPCPVLVVPSGRPELPL